MEQRLLGRCAHPKVHHGRVDFERGGREDRVARDRMAEAEVLRPGLRQRLEDLGRWIDALWIELGLREGIAHIVEAAVGLRQGDNGSA